MQAEIEAPEELPDDALGARFEFTILFALRSEVSMKFDLKMRAIGPTGVAEKEFSYPLTLPGDGRGHNVVVAASIGAKRSGWYWMDVYADEFGMLVRIPLELVIQRKRR